MKYFIFILLSILSLIGFGQQYSFIPYSQEEGLAQSQVRCINQDSKGYMWIGTLGGLSQFDGREFSNFTKIDGLTGNFGYAILELKDKRLVIGGLGSISFYNNGKFDGLQFKGEFEKAVVNDLIEINENELWIATNLGLVTYRKGKLSYRKFPDIASKNNITEIEKISEQEVVFNISNKIIKYDGLNIDVVYEFKNKSITDFHYQDDRVWVATTKGIYLLKNKNNKYVLEKSYNEETSFNSVLMDSSGILWGLSNVGCYLITTDKTIIINKQNGLPTQNINIAFEDYEGNIWLGTEGSGMLKFTSTNITTYTTKDGLSSDLVMSFTEDANQTIWVATFDGGLNNISQGTAAPFELSSAKGKRIWNNTFASDSTLWFGTNIGLMKMKNEKFHYYAREDLVSKRILTIFEDKDQTIWVGTRKGVNYIIGDSIFTLKTPKDINLNKTRTITQDSVGNIWFGALHGIFKYNGTSFIRYTEKNGLSDNSTYDIDIDHKGNLWIGSPNGVSLFKNGEAVTYKVDKHAMSNRINFLHIKDKHLLLGSNNGMYVLDLDEFYIRQKTNFIHLSIEDGLTSLEMNQNAVFTDSKGYIWVGSTKGAAKINSIEEIFVKSVIKPKIVLKDIKLNLQTVDWSNYNTPLDPLTKLPSELVVGHKKNHFTFEFTALSFSYPNDVVYRYKLNGFDNEWQPLTSITFATYSNLDADSYHFEVQCKNKNGTWSDTQDFSFTITPPYWLRWWFILSIIILTAILIRFIYTRRQKAINLRYEKDKYEFQSKMLDLEQQSLNSSMNRHFLFNSLNSIQYYINTQDRLAANRYLTSFAKLIRKNLDSSQTKTTSLADEIERLKLYLELENMRFKDKFEYLIDIDSSIDQDAVKVPSMLLQPFLENSIWHGLLPLGTKGELLVQIQPIGDNKIEILIKDNGIGIDVSLKNKEQSKTKSHDSKGMNITKNRIDLLHKMTGTEMKLIGPYEIKDLNNETIGTEVRITMTNNYVNNI